MPGWPVLTSPVFRSTPPQEGVGRGLVGCILDRRLEVICSYRPVAVLQRFKAFGEALISIAAQIQATVALADPFPSGDLHERLLALLLKRSWQWARLRIALLEQARIKRLAFNHGGLDVAVGAHGGIGVAGLFQPLFWVLHQAFELLDHRLWTVKKAR